MNIGMLKKRAEIFLKILSFFTLLLFQYCGSYMIYSIVSFSINLKQVLNSFISVMILFSMNKRMKEFSELILIILKMMTLTHGSKLEHWQHPEIQDSIEPTALQYASRNPKIFGGVSI